jgi:hypothetical protein
LYFCNLRSVSFLSMPYSCINRQSMKIQSRLFQVLGLFRTGCSIEFQGPGSGNVNLRRSENCIFRIYGPKTFCWCLTRVSIDSPWRYKAGYSRCIIGKDVKVNIMRFRTLRSIEFQGLCSRNWNLTRSENCIFAIYGPYKYQVEWLCRRQSTAWPTKLNGYAEDSQRHNHPSCMVMPKTVNGITIQVEWLCRRHSTA